MRPIILAILAIAACDPTYLDEGLMVREGLTLHADRSMGITPGQYSEEVAQWWNEQCGAELFHLTGATPDVQIEVGFVAGEDTLGDALVDFDLFDGRIARCVITVSSDIAYHEATAIEVAKHEAGHCLGLDDDPSSLDLNSIMSDPLLYRGEVTPGDCDLVVRWLENGE